MSPFKDGVFPPEPVVPSKGIIPEEDAVKYPRGYHIRFSEEVERMDSEAGDEISIDLGNFVEQVENATAAELIGFMTGDFTDRIFDLGIEAKDQQDFGVTNSLEGKDFQKRIRIAARRKGIMAARLLKLCGEKA